ncbi:hypothetical protein MBLNU457_g2710t1 [Dothideomycetes sp. NU457]
MSERDIIDREHMHEMRAQNRASPGSSSDTVRVARRAANRSDESNSSNSSTEKAPSVFSQGPPTTTPRSSLGSTSDDVEELPKELSSQKTLVYCGFADDVATTIFNRWNVPEVREEFDLGEFAVKYLRSHKIDNCGGPEDDWDAYLRSCGANDQVRKAITRPGHDNIRYTQTAQYWFVWSIESKYAYLVYIKEASKGYGDQIREQRAQAADTSGSTPGQPTSARSQGGNTTDSPSAPPTAFVGRTGRIFSSRVAAPGKTVLWKGCDRVRVEQCWNKSYRQGIYSFNHLLSAPGGDFNPTKKVYYFTNTIAGAQHYARYMSAFASSAGVCLVRIELSNEAIDDARPYLLNYPLDEFKKAVWHGRREIDYRRQYPGNQVDLNAVHGAHFLIGDTCRGNKDTFEKMEAWSSIGLRNLVMLPRTPTEDDPREKEPMKQHSSPFTSTTTLTIKSPKGSTSVNTESAQAITKLGDWHNIDEGHLVKVKKDTTEALDGPEDIAGLTPEQIKDQYENVKQHVFDDEFYDSLGDASKAITIHNAVDHTAVFEEGIDWRQYKEKKKHD